MLQKTSRRLAACCLLSITCFISAAQDQSERHNREDEALLFQASTLDALRLGLYQGVYSISALKRQGDFGVGTFEEINGEMTVLNGHFYDQSQVFLPFAVNYYSLLLNEHRRGRAVGM